MKTEQFEKVIEEQIERIKEVLIFKAKEYATEDRLHNFRVSAQLQNITMEQALAGMLSKHTVSIYDMIASGDRYGVDKWEEKIIDHINYLLLLRAIIEEKRTHEYIIDTDMGPIVANGPTYSAFEADMSYQMFLNANPHLKWKYTNFVNKDFHVSTDINESIKDLNKKYGLDRFEKSDFEELQNMHERGPDNNFSLEDIGEICKDQKYGYAEKTRTFIERLLNYIKSSEVFDEKVINLMREEKMEVLDELDGLEKSFQTAQKPIINKENGDISINESGLYQLARDINEFLRNRKNGGSNR